MLMEERIGNIRRELRHKGILTVDEVAERYSVSADTIRRDFGRLAKDPGVRRTHGGLLLNRHDNDSTLAERRLRASSEKYAIARAAAALVQDFDTIALDAGSTTALMVDEIAARDVTVITYSVEIAARAIQRDNLNVYIAGGAVRKTTASIVGDDAIQMIRSLQAARSFIGANGVSILHGLMTPNYHEASVKRALLEIGQINVLLADSSKLERRALVRFGDLSQIDLLLTDEEAPDDFVHAARLQARSVYLVAADRRDRPR